MPTEPVTAPTDHAALAARLTEALGLARPPIAVCLTDRPPAGVAGPPRPVAAGCVFWQDAARGAIATGLFASKAINSAGADGLFFGNPGQLITQIKAVVITWVFVFIASFIILKIVDAIVGLRVSDEEEKMGLDLAQHHESAYN